MLGVAAIIKSISDTPPVDIPEIVIHTTSVSSSWFCALVNTGGPLSWSSSGGVVIAEQEYAGNNAPVLDLSSNTGTAIISIKSSSSFVGLTEFLADGGFEDADNITYIDVTEATDIVTLSCKEHANLTSVDTSTLTGLQLVVLRSNPLMTSIDFSNNSDIIHSYVYSNALTDYNVLHTPLAVTLFLHTNQIGSTEMDLIVNRLDTLGQINGSLRLDANPGDFTSACYTSYQNLISKGWTIQPVSPEAPVAPPSEDGLAPVLSNFHIKPLFTDRLYFDSSENIAGNFLTGFTVFGKSFLSSSSVVINSLNTTDHYFIMSEDFSFWDNNTIKYEGGSDIENEDGRLLYDFTMEPIVNNISKPSTTTVRYAASTSQGTGDGTSEANAWSYTDMVDSSKLTSTGTLVHVKAGTSSAQLNIGRSGTATAPIIYKGYKTTPGDLDGVKYFSYGDTVDGADAPLLSGSGTGQGIYNTSVRNYIIFENMQFNYYENNIRMWGGEMGRVYENCVSTNGEDANFRSSNPSNSQIRYVDCIGVNSRDQGINLTGSYNAAIRCESYGDRGASATEGQDYYIMMEAGSLYNYIKDCHIERKATAGHSGHGFSMKGAGHSLIKGGTAYGINAPIQFRHSASQNNVAKDITVDGKSISSTGAIAFRDGASNNIVERCTFKDATDTNYGWISMFDSSEDGGYDQTINNNIVKNNIFNNSINSSAPFLMIGLDSNASGGTTFNLTNNKFYNNTFYEGVYLIRKKSVGTDSGNEFKNNIVSGVTNYDFTDETITGWTFDYNNYYDQAWTQGTNVTTINPNFVDVIDFIPQNNIDTPKLSGVDYDIDRNERASTTTKGVAEVNSVLTPVMTNFRVEDSNKDRVLFDTPLGSVSGIDHTDFIIQGKTINAVDTTNNYFTLSADLDFWDNILIRKEAGNSVGCHDFTLQYVANQIDEPTTLNNKYVEAGASGAGTLGDPMGLEAAATESTPNTTYWIKAGNYGTINATVANSGTTGNPIKFIGYKTNPVEGDAPLLDRAALQASGSSFSSTDMPLLTGSDSIFTASSKSKIIIKNIQIDGDPTSASANANVNLNGSNNVYVYNVYTDEGYFGIWNFGSSSHTTRIRRCYTSNVDHGGIRVRNKYNLVDDSWAVGTYSTGFDYYISLYAGSDGHSNCIRGSKAYRWPTDSHTGHGFAFRGNLPSESMEYSLVENSESWNMRNGGIEFRRSSANYNVARGVYIGNDTPQTLTDTRGIQLSHGTRFNHVENCHIENQNRAFYYTTWWEEDDTYDFGGTDNTIKNTIANDCYYGIVTNQTDGSNPDENANNDFINCTFQGITSFIYDPVDTFNGTNTFVNTILDEIAASSSGQPTHTNNLIHSSWTTSVGTGSINIDPQLDSNFQPQANFDDIDIPKVSTTPYDNNSSERKDPTTVGAIKHNNE